MHIFDIFVSDTDNITSNICLLFAFFKNSSHVASILHNIVYILQIHLTIFYICHKKDYHDNKFILILDIFCINKYQFIHKYF